MVLLRPLTGQPELTELDRSRVHAIFDDVGDPMSATPSQAACCALSLDALITLADLRPLPTGRELAPVIMGVVATAAPRYRTKTLSRRIGIHADCFTATHVWRWMPDLAEHASAEVAEIVARATGARAAAQRVAGSQLLRLAWRTDAGALLIDEISPGYTPDMLRNTWMNTRVAAHHVLLAGEPGYAGVRVLAPRIPGASLHVRPDNTAHHLGGCDACASLTPFDAPPATAPAAAITPAFGPVAQVCELTR